jgi:hypothetical protein
VPAGAAPGPPARALRRACGLHRPGGSRGNPRVKEHPQRALDQPHCHGRHRDRPAANRLLIDGGCRPESWDGVRSPMRTFSPPGKSWLKAVGETRSDGAQSSRPAARRAPARTGRRPPCPAFTAGVPSVRANTTTAGALLGDRDRGRRGRLRCREQEPPACSAGSSDGRHGQSSTGGACRCRAAPRGDAAAGAHRWMDGRRRGSRSPRSMDRTALRCHVHAL